MPEGIQLDFSSVPVEDQEYVGSCQSVALTSILEFYKHGRLSLSRLFLYYNTRAHECNQKENTGATLRSTLKAAKKFGVCLESLWPYDLSRFASKPSLPAYENGPRTVEILSYRRITGGASDVRDAIINAKPVLFGIKIKGGFAADSDGNVPGPMSGFPAGGHAMVVTGYSNAQRVFKVRNSWGAGWGFNGDCYLPYAWFDDKGIVFDMWVVETREIDV